MSMKNNEYDVVVIKVVDGDTINLKRLIFSE